MKWVGTFDYKLACDGYDLSTKFDGSLLNELAVKYAHKHCKIDQLPEAEEFIASCIRKRQQLKLTPRDIPEELCDKYEVGYFETSPESCFDSLYILFNKDELDFWHDVNTDLWGLQFMVVPSRDRSGTINEIGFRILNPEKIKDSFKWLFAYGQQATFGMHLCDIDSPLLLVEGFQDMLAFRESGYNNVVGLGSAKVTEAHKAQLKTDDYIFCQDMDSFGMSERKDLSRTCFYIPEGKDPYEVWQNHGQVDILKIDA